MLPRKLKTKRLKEKRCPICGNMFKPVFSALQTVCSPLCAIEWNKTTEVDKRVKKMKIDTHSQEHRNTLQEQINLLSRKIDIKFGYEMCIDDCGQGYGKQTDAAHYFSRKKNSTLRYNLHNLHSANSQCNQWSDQHKEGYKRGLEKRYGRDYLDYVLQLPLMYKEIKLSNVEVVEKLKVVRLLIRTMHTYKFNSAIEAREYFNKIINIYQ